MTPAADIDGERFLTTLRQQAIWVTAGAGEARQLRLTVNTTILRQPLETLVTAFAWALQDGAPRRDGSPWAKAQGLLRFRTAALPPQCNLWPEDHKLYGVSLMRRFNFYPGAFLLEPGEAEISKSRMPQPH